MVGEKLEKRGFSPQTLIYRGLCRQQKRASPSLNLRITSSNAL